MAHNKRLALLCVSALMMLNGTASAGNGPVGSVEIGTSSLSVFPAVPYAQLQLTVSGGDVYWQQKYGPGETASISTAKLPDGQYGYQVIASPEVDTALMEQADGDEALAKRLEREERAQTYIQSGSFEIAGGANQPEEIKESPATRAAREGAN